MGAFAAILIAGGIVALIVGGYLKFKAGRIAKTPLVQTGSVASTPGNVAVEGPLQCPQPLISPASGTPCLYYSLKVEGSWKEGDTKKSKTYVEEKHAAAFTIDDGSGAIPVDASGGGDMDTKKTFDETKKEGFFADLKGAVGKKEPIVFGSYNFDNPPMSKANKFTCVERTVAIPEKAFVLGKSAEGVITSPGMFGIMLTSKSREELLGASAKNSKMAIMAGAAAGGVGALLAIVSAIM